MIVNLIPNDLMARVCNATMPDEEADAMVEIAALDAADQVRREAQHRRGVEKHSQELDRQRVEAQKLRAESNRLQNEREREAALADQARLRELETKNGPRRGYNYKNSGW